MSLMRTRMYYVYAKYDIKCLCYMIKFIILEYFLHIKLLNAYEKKKNHNLGKKV